MEYMVKIEKQQSIELGKLDRIQSQIDSINDGYSYFIDPEDCIDDKDHSDKIDFFQPFCEKVSNQLLTLNQILANK